MNEPVTLLLIDDNPDDRSLVIREVRKEFATLSIREIIDSNSFDRATDGDKPDLVITDYQLRWTDGLKILKRIKQKWPDCPVLMFTGTGSEEIAVEAMKSGLDDYVLKSPRHFARLPSAAKMAIRTARHKRELKDAESRYTTLFDTVPVGLFRATPLGEIIDANPAFAEMLGYTNGADLVERQLPDLHLERSVYDRWRETMERDGEVRQFQARLLCSNGDTCWTESHTRAVRDPKTRLIVYEGSMENISERKHAEGEREALIQRLQDALGHVKTLSGLLPICASCKKIRDDKGYWNQLEVYIQNHSNAAFTHSFCPECARRLYPEIYAPLKV